MSAEGFKYAVVKTLFSTYVIRKVIGESSKTVMLEISGRKKKSHKDIIAFFDTLDQAKEAIEDAERIFDPALHKAKVDRTAAEVRYFDLVLQKKMAIVTRGRKIT